MIFPEETVTEYYQTYSDDAPRSLILQSSLVGTSALASKRARGHSRAGNTRRVGSMRAIVGARSHGRHLLVEGPGRCMRLWLLIRRHRPQSAWPHTGVGAVLAKDTTRTMMVLV